MLAYEASHQHRKFSPDFWRLVYKQNAEVSASMRDFHEGGVIAAVVRL